jgi:hypothetical protein
MPLGSAAETAIPTTIGLSKTLVHSSGVKFCLFAMAASDDGEPRGGFAEEINSRATRACSTVSSA